MRFGSPEGVPTTFGIEALLRLRSTFSEILSICGSPARIAEVAPAAGRRARDLLLRLRRITTRVSRREACISTCGCEALRTAPILILSIRAEKLPVCRKRQPRVRDSLTRPELITGS